MRQLRPRGYSAPLVFGDDVKVSVDVPARGNVGLHDYALFGIRRQQPLQRLAPSDSPVIHLVSFAQILVDAGERVEVNVLVRMQPNHLNGGYGEGRRDQGIDARSQARLGLERRSRAPKRERRQKAHGRVYEIQMPPAVVNVGIERYHGDYGSDGEGDQQQREPLRRVPRSGAPSPHPREERERRARRRKRQRRRRYGHQYPLRNVKPRNVRRADHLAVKQIVARRVSRLRPESVYQRHRLLPQQRPSGVQRGGKRQRKRRQVSQNGERAFSPRRRIPAWTRAPNRIQSQRPHDRRERHDS